MAAAPAVATPWEAAEERAAPALEWLSSILWPDGDVRVTPCRADGPAAWYSTTEHGEPRLLVPAGPHRATSRSLRRFHDGHGARERLTRAVAATVVPLAPGRLLLPLAVEGTGEGLLGEIAEALGVRDPRFAVTLGPPRGNRKAVVQVLTAGGHAIAFAKIAHDGTTRALVSNELRWLRRLDGRAGSLAVPRALGELETRGRLVALLSPLGSSAVGRRRTALAPIAAQVAGAAGTGRHQVLGETPWAREVRTALAGGPAIAALEQLGDRTVEVGLAHGDLAPWNVLRRRGRVALIDWEHAADGRPVGLDALRGTTQTGLHLLGLDAAATLAMARRAAARLVAHGQGGGLGAAELNQVLLLDVVRRAADPDAGPRDRELAELAARQLGSRRTTEWP